MKKVSGAGGNNKLLWFRQESVRDMSLIVVGWQQRVSIVEVD